MSNIKTHPLTEVESERLKKLLTSHSQFGQSYIRTEPGNCVIPPAYEKYKDRIRNLQLRPDDVYVLTWAKNGTTFTQEMVWCIQNNFNVGEAKQSFTLLRVPFVELMVISDFLEGKEEGYVSVDMVKLINEMPSPRVIKSHLPYCLLPPGILDRCKVVTCLRNPKDTVVSFYHHEKLIKLHGFVGDFAEYFDVFMDDLVMISPYWAYTREAWKLRNHPNLCLLFFEDMKKDLEGSVRKVAKFLEKDATDGEIKELVEHLTFKNMKQHSTELEDGFRKLAYLDPNDKQRSFFRKGEVGDWKNHFTDEMNRRMDERIKKEFRGTGLEFRYE